MKHMLLITGVSALLSSCFVKHNSYSSTIASPIIGKTKASRLLSSMPKKKPSPSSNTSNGGKVNSQFNLISNYVFRGISQTNNTPAAQGGVSYTQVNTGLYGGVWVSNSHFKDSFGNITYLEFSPSLGVSNRINDHLNYDVAVSYYLYPGVKQANYPEFNAYVYYDLITTHIAYSNDVYATKKYGMYYNVGLNYPIPTKYAFNYEGVRIAAAVGYSQLPNGQGFRSYQDYSLLLSKTIQQFACAIQWTDTNRRSFDNAALKGNLFVVMIGRSF